MMNLTDVGHLVSDADIGEDKIAEETTDAFWNLDGNADANGQATRRSRALVTAAGK